MAFKLVNIHTLVSKLTLNELYEAFKGKAVLLKHGLQPWTPSNLDTQFGDLKLPKSDPSHCLQSHRPAPFVCLKSNVVTIALDNTVLKKSPKRPFLDPKETSAGRAAQISGSLAVNTTGSGDGSFGSFGQVWE